MSRLGDHWVTHAVTEHQGSREIRLPPTPTPGRGVAAQDAPGDLPAPTGSPTAQRWEEGIKGVLRWEGRVSGASEERGRGGEGLRRPRSRL